MTPNKLTFQFENLVVDYISFNITGFMDPASMDKIASYLSKLFGFNSTLGKGNGVKPKEEIIFYDAKNLHKVYSVTSMLGSTSLPKISSCVNS